MSLSFSFSFLRGGMVMSSVVGVGKEGVLVGEVWEAYKP